MSKTMLRDAALHLKNVIQNNARKCEILFERSSEEIGLVLKWIETASEVEHAVCDLFHALRSGVLAELGPVENLSDIERVLAGRLRETLHDPEQMREAVGVLVGKARAIAAELAPPAEEETPAAPVEPPMTPTTEPAPSPDAPAPGPDLAAMASARSGGVPLPEKPVENAAAETASGATPSGE